MRRTLQLVMCSCRSAARVSYEEYVYRATRMRTRTPPWGPGARHPLALNVFKMKDDALADPPAYPVGHAIGADENVMEIID